mgnify:FL=1
MSAHAIELLQDDQLLQQFREGARMQAASFDISNILPIYETLYQKVVEAYRS